MNSSFSFSRLGVISPISSARWAVWTGGSAVTIWSFCGRYSRCALTNSVMSSPSGRSGSSDHGSGPTMRVADENNSGWRSTVIASSCPVTITTP